MINPFEPISATPLDAESMEALHCAKRAYRCPKCREVFEIDNYKSVDVYYGVDLIKCDCCAAYSRTPLDEDNTHEVAWHCGNGCFVHDAEESPEAANEEGFDVEIGWMCTKKHLHASESAATNC